MVTHCDKGAAFEQYQVVPMKADWTNRDETIAAWLAQFDRYSVPTYVLYRPGREPHLFPELLTKEMLLGELED